MTWPEPRAPARKQSPPQHPDTHVSDPLSGTHACNSLLCKQAACVKSMARALFVLWSSIPGQDCIKRQDAAPAESLRHQPVTLPTKPAPNISSTAASTCLLPSQSHQAAIRATRQQLAAIHSTPDLHCSCAAYLKSCVSQAPQQAAPH